MKTYFTDYVNHALRFYVRYPNPNFSTEVDKKNWLACDKAFAKFDIDDKDMFLTVYEDDEFSNEKMRKVAEKYKLSTATVWKKVTELENIVAKERGLL